MSEYTDLKTNTITIRVPENATNEDVMNLVFGIPRVIGLDPDWLNYIDEYYAPDVLAWLNAPYKQKVEQ